MGRWGRRRRRSEEVGRREGRGWGMGGSEVKGKARETEEKKKENGQKRKERQEQITDKP